MHEYVFATITVDEAVAFFCIEELNGTSSQLTLSSLKPTIRHNDGSPSTQAGAQFNG